MANKAKSEAKAVEPEPEEEPAAEEVEEPKKAREAAAPEAEEVEEEAPAESPIIEDDLTIKLLSRREEKEKEVKQDRFIGNNLWVVGSGLTSVPGEVIVDVARENGSDHARFSFWAEDEKFEFNLPGTSGTGTWLIHAEQAVVDVSEGREDGKPVILTSNELELELI